MPTKLLISFVLMGLIFTSCKDEDASPAVSVPDNYEFTRDGQSTVNYQGQTDRLNMSTEIKTYLKQGNAGEPISSSHLLDMFANNNAPFTDPALNASTKQLENKTFVADVQWFKDLFAGAEAASQTGVTATQGQAGRIERGTSGSFILVNEKGWEFTEFVEKGLMGAVFYNQIYNTYLTDAETGDNVDNENLLEGTNYTAMEHHWDEAFGYWGVPVNYPEGNPVLPEGYDRFWAEYTHSTNDLLGTGEQLMEAYLTGRAAIVAKKYDIKNEQKKIIYAQHELVAAAKAVHYIHSAMNDMSAGDQGNLFHHLSEGYGFVKALQYSPLKKISQSEIDSILKTDFGVDGDFWTITLQGLKNAEAKIIAAYPELEAVQNQL